MGGPLNECLQSEGYFRLKEVVEKLKKKLAKAEKEIGRLRAEVNRLAQPIVKYE